MREGGEKRGIIFWNKRRRRNLYQGYFSLKGGREGEREEIRKGGGKEIR